MTTTRWVGARQVNRVDFSAANAADAGRKAEAPAAGPWSVGARVSFPGGATRLAIMGMDALPLHADAGAAAADALRLILSTS